MAEPFARLRLGLAIRKSRASLGKIGEGDWTPQDTAHLELVREAERFLLTARLRTGRIIHGDAEAD